MLPDNLRNSKDYNTTSSNGNSIVYISLTDSNVYQYFKYTQVVSSIKNMMQKFKQNSKVTRGIKLKKGFGPGSIVYLDTVITYNIFDYVSRYISTNGHTITWEKLKPLNSIPNVKLFVIKNLYKILWDVEQALYAIHKRGYVHNDCRIDNIGINKKGNFTLFDFDGSVKIGERHIYPDKDFKNLRESINFVTDLKVGNENILDMIVKNEGVSYKESLLLVLV
jgi:serine/threonine protein kinase